MIDKQMIDICIDDREMERLKNNKKNELALDGQYNLNTTLGL